MNSNTFRRISSGLLSLILVLQVLVQPVMAVQNTNDLPTETKTEEMKNDVHSETIISPAIKKKLSPLELNYVNRLEDDSFAFLRGPFVMSSEEDFDIKDYTFVEKDEKGKVAIIKGEDSEEFSNIDELNKIIKEYRKNYELYEKKELDELEPVEALLKITYKEYDELSVPLVINNLENKFESTKNENLTLKRDEEELTKEIFVNSLKDLEELLLNFKGEEEVKDLDIKKVEKVYSGEEDENTITVEEVYKEVLEEAHEDENKVTSLNLDELDPGYKYIFTLSSKEVKDENKVLTEITSLEKDQDEKEVEELGKTIIEEEKETEETTDETDATEETEATDATDKKETDEVVEETEETKEQKEKTPQENKIEKETTEEDEKVQEFEKALEETKEEIEQDPNKEEEKKGVVEGIKKLFGFTDLQKADKELKAALEDEKNGLEEIQNLLNSFEEKYELTREEQLQLMEDNGDAIKALIAKDSDENFRPHIFAISNSFDDKKFTITAPITLSTIAGPIQTSQKITLKLDEKLTVKNGTTIAPLKNDKGTVIANGIYDSASNSIIYTFKAPIREKTTLNLNQEVDFNTEVIRDAKEITVQNSISAPGMASAKNFPKVNVKINDSNPSSATEIDSGDMELEFITEIEYFTETLTRSTNEGKLFEIVRNNTTENLSDQQIRSDYVGWKINIPGVDVSGMDIREIKKDKYDYNNLNFSLYAPAGQSLEDYKVVVEDGEGGKTTYSGSMTEKIGDHYVYSFSIPKAKLTDKGYNIYVVAKAPKKRQNYAVGLKIEPDNNYVLSILKKFEDKFEDFAKGNPFVYKWKDTSAANPYANGIELLDTRMVYIEPNGWQDLFPYNEFKSVDYNDNIDDTDIMKNTVSMFGNIDKEGNISWTISETFPAEKLENKNTVGVDAYSAKSDSGKLENPSVQILVPNKTGGYDAKNLGNISISELQNQIGNRPGTIVNYTFTDKAKDKEEFTTLSLDSGKKASIAYKPSLLQREEGAEKDTTGLAYLHKVQEHKDGPGYEIALAGDQAHTLTAFIPKNPSANPRYNDPAFKDTGVVVFCLNPGKPEPTRQYKFNGTITKGEWSTDKGSWAKHGRDLASLATASEAKASPLYKGQANDSFYASLYEHILRMYWYGQEMAKEYQLDQQSYYKIIQYNLYYWIAGENYAENFRNGGGYNPNYFSSAEYSYAQGLKNRISQGKDWDKVNYDEDIEIYYYGHDKSRSYQNTITGDTKKPAKKGSVTVNKIDKDGKKLPGAYFQLLDENKTPIKTLVTDANGVAKFEELDYGTYYIKEVQAPKGYIITGQLSKVEVNGEKAHVSFNVTNTKNEIEFRKVNENGLAMDGVVFELRQNGRPISDQDKTSARDGKFSWKELTPGYYEVVEKKVNNPLYSENEGRVVASFRVDENNKIQDKVIYYPNGSSTTDIKNEKNEGKPIGIEFTKVDLKTGKELEGAEFVLEYKKPGSSIFRELPGSRRRSNSQGKLVWNDLVDGDYRVIETKAPDGDNYNTDLNLGEKATFTIEKNQNGYYEITNITPDNKEITNKEKPEEPKEYFGEFEFTKVDSEDKKPLQGVEFTLTSEGQVGPEKDKFDYKVSKTTDADGKIKYTKLYPGTYTLKETKQLPGYQENTKTWKVVVDDLGKTTIPDLENNKYELVFDNNDTELRSENYAFLKETLEQNPRNPNGMIYKITIKPKRELYQVVLGFDRWSGLESYALENNSRIQKSSLPKVGEEKTFTYYISIKDVETFKKNTPTSPIGSLQLWKDEIGNYQSVGSKPKFTLKSNSESSGLTITNDKEKPEPANLTIKKVDDETKEGLEGAKFRLYHTRNDAENNGHYIQEVESNEHGYAVFDSPEIQNNTTYYVKEIAAPDGYKITSAITAVKSSATEDNTINAEIPNDKNNARFELYKKGSDGEYLAGVKFKLTNKTTKKFVELETDGNGYLSYDKLKINTSYELEEISTVEGYTRNEAKAIIKVDASGKVTVDTNSLAIAKEGEELGLVLVATNIKKPSIDFVKQDGASKNPLYGAEFVLYKDGTEVTNSLTSSDKEGKFGFDNLKDGSYTVYETASPDGYPYLEEKLIVATFTVKDGKVTELKTNQQYDETSIENFDPNEAYPIYNKINEIKFTKIGKDNQALAGAKFKLDRVWDSYDDNGKLHSNRETVLENIETLDDGIITLSATKAGRYQLVETQAPEGYKQINTKNTAGGQIVAEFTVERVTLDIKNVLVGNIYIQDMNDYTGDLKIFNKEEGKGKFQVKKVEKRDYSGYVATIPLEGAKFLLKDMESGQYVMTDGTFTRNSGAALTKGEATVNYENLAVGEYELREFKAPDGYVRTINTWKVVVTDESTTTIVLKDKYDKAVDATTTDETSTSPAKLQLVNKSNEIEFTKIDSKTEDPLKDVEFEIWWDQQGKRNDSGVTYKKYVKIPNPDGGTTFKTDKNGKFKLKNLGTGHYKIYEVKVPDGYKVEDKPTDNEPIADAKGEFVNEFFVDIDGDIKKNEGGVVDGEGENLITTIKNTPITGKFRVQKVGENGVDKLDGASFALYKVVDGNTEGEAIKSVAVENTTGLIEFADLEDGEYLLEETKAPEGYTLSKAKWNITIKEGKVNIQATDGSTNFTRTDDTLTLNVVNKKPQGRLKLIKVDEEDNRLEGAKFKLTGVTDTEFSKEVESNKNGEIIFEELPEGKYTLEETKAAKGYITNRDLKWDVVVENGGKTTITVQTSTPESTEQSLNNLFVTTSYAAENGETPGSDSGNEGTTDQGATEDTKIEPSEIDDLTGKDDKLKELNSSGYLIVNADGNNNSITTIKVVNKKGIFPSTGGIGAAIFAITGLSLMTVAYIGYRRKREIV